MNAKTGVSIDVRALKVAGLMFGSGFSALVYQIVWLREMRLVFGSSTPASGAVLAIFMAGLGLGGWVLGRRVDRSKNPLLLYSYLEFSIALAALASPYLLDLTRNIYVSMGGALAMGLPLATLVRLALSAFVLGIPTFLMGGTLPAAVRAVVTADDTGRRKLAFLYGLNTLGGVAGATVSTFILLEMFGARDTLLVACLLNALVAIAARSIAQRIGEPSPSSRSQIPVATLSPASAAPRECPRLFVYSAAAFVGAAFFVMELAWYRMLSPLLGGSTYTFGLILAVALLGIGLGGALYSLPQRQRASTLRGFALTCSLEALFIALPYALGDRIATTAALLQPLREMGLVGAAAGWTLITGLVVFPSAVVAGYQFPLLINLLGQGSDDVGKHTGYAYAWNTFGAILGSLAGGFLLIPLMTAPGVWKAVVLALGLLGIAATLLAAKNPEGAFSKICAVVIIFAACGLLLAQGPTAAWRHSPIGAGRINLTNAEMNGIRRWQQDTQRSIVWQAEGMEAMVGLGGSDGYTFLVNGKSDGNVKTDATTQVMLGLTSALLHAAPRTSLVVGLGTGCSAGWLAEVPGMERVDVAELEPAILEVARYCAPANFNVLAHPKVRVIQGDARELLLTTHAKYDLIASEPSNPYRAGVASLFTREFYQAVAQRLNPGGMFSQWVQAYEIDTETVLSICATLGTVFPYIQIWQTNPNDALLICSMEEIPLSAELLRAKIQTSPFKQALLHVWGGADLEAFFARHVANSDFVTALLRQKNMRIPLNLDDKMTVEFGFARSLGRGKAFSLLDVRRVAKERNEHLPKALATELNPGRLRSNDLRLYPALDLGGETPDELRLKNIYRSYTAKDYATIRSAWHSSSWSAEYPSDIAMLAVALAEGGDAEALPLIEKLRPFWPTESDVIEGGYRLRKGEHLAAFQALERAFVRFRTDPWPQYFIMLPGLEWLGEMAASRKELSKPILDLLAAPFSVSILEAKRQMTRSVVAMELGCDVAVPVFHEFEPHVPWEKTFLSNRATCYRKLSDPLAEHAENDFRTFILDSTVSFTKDIFRVQ